MRQFWEPPTQHNNMSRVHLLPRLSSIGVEQFLSRGKLEPVGDARELTECAVQLSYAASGGSVDNDAALEIARGLRWVAEENGFPDSNSARYRAAFDQNGAIFLSGEPRILSGEGYRDDVWACITTLLAPDVVSWRFPERASERFHGGVRNAFQRLWVRGIALDRGLEHDDRWGLVKALTEDAMVQIFERPSLAGHKALSRAIAEAWVATAETCGRSAMEDVMRSAIKLIRLRIEIVDLGSLYPDDMQREVMEIFERAAEWQQAAQLTEHAG